MKLKWLQIYTLLGLIVIYLFSPSVHSEELQAITYEQLNTDIQDFLQSQFNMQNDDRLEVIVSGFDKRFGIKNCEQPLHYSLPNFSKLQARTSVSVSCIGSKSWHMLLPVQVKLYHPIVHTTRTLMRNDAITRDAIKLVDANILARTQGYFDNVDDVLGWVAKRHLKTGEVLTHDHITQATLVHRGDIVRLSAKTKGIVVRTHALAMENGKLGDSIQVKNSRSQKVVQAVVTDAQTVEVF